MEKVLAMSEVRKKFDHVEAISGLTFHVEKGEIFGFLGPSGAGKTTTIKLLTRQLIADAGNITIFGRDVSAFSNDDYRQIGIMTDNSGLYERLSVWDNLALFAGIKGLKDQDIVDVLEEVGLGDQRKKPAKALSRGMKRRVVLARAILHKPQLLFLDEPTSALDPANTLSIHKLLKKLNQAGTTVFLTTHNMEEADKLCARVAFLNQGRIAEIGEPMALKLKHSTGKVIVQFEDGGQVEGEKSADSLAHLSTRIGGRRIARIYSQEPNLEQIFLAVTGRELA